MLVSYVINSREPTLENRTAELNRATEGTFGEGYVQVRNMGKDIKPGYYDVTANKPIIVNGNDMDSENPLIGQIYYDSNSLEIIGDGEAVFTPAKFDKLDFSAGKTVTIKNDGYYSVPQQLEAGKYRIWSDYQPQMIQGYESIDTIILEEEIPVSKKNALIVTLKKGETIEIILFNGKKNDVFLEKVQ